MTSNAPCFPDLGRTRPSAPLVRYSFAFLAPLAAIPLATISKETRYYQISLPGERKKKKRKKEKGKTDGGALRITIYLEKKEGAG